MHSFFFCYLKKIVFTIIVYAVLLGLCSMVLTKNHKNYYKDIFPSFTVAMNGLKNIFSNVALLLVPEVGRNIFNKYIFIFLNPKHVTPSPTQIQWVFFYTSITIWIWREHNETMTLEKRSNPVLNGKYSSRPVAWAFSRKRDMRDRSLQRYFWGQGRP